MKKLIKYLKFSVLISLFLLALYIVFYRLGWSFLENWDEAWVGEAVRNMLRRGEYFVLYWNGEIWLDKPPVYFWLSAFWVKIFGLSEFSLRFTSALSGLILIFWVTVYSFKNFGFFPSLLAFSTLCFNNIFIWRARSGNLDTLLALLVWMSYLLIQSRLKNKYVFLGLLLAGIYLTKASVVFLPLTALVGYEVFFVK